MPNDRLRDALHDKGFTPESLAVKIKVDSKTIERWITTNRTPYPKHRHAVAAALTASETYLWPNALTPDRQMVVSQSEIIETYPRRYAVPGDLWRRLLENATEFIGVLAYAGLFLPEHDPTLIQTLKNKAAAGTKITILVGHPESDAVANRGKEEGIGGAMAAKIQNVLSFYDQLKDTEGVFVGFHGTTLYNSVYRYDNEMLVNTHVYGFPAAHAPVVHLKQLAGGAMFDTYTQSFDRVWSQSKSIWGEEHGKVRAWHG